MRLYLAWLVLLWSLPAALAQFSARGEVALGVDGALFEAFPAQVGWTPLPLPCRRGRWCWGRSLFRWAKQGA